MSIVNKISLLLLIISPCMIVIVQGNHSATVLAVKLRWRSCRVPWPRDLVPEHGVVIGPGWDGVRLQHQCVEILPQGVEEILPPAGVRSPIKPHVGEVFSPNPGAETARDLHPELGYVQGPFRSVRW